MNTPDCQAEALLQADCGVYRFLVEHASEGMARIDADGCLAFANRRLAEMTGYDSGELIGMHYTSFHPPEEHERVIANFVRRREGFAGKVEYRLLRKDGSLGWCMVGTNPQFDAAGNFLGLIVIVTDIGERKRREEIEGHERRLLRQISGNYPLAAVMEALCRALEELSRRPLYCAVMLADADGRRLECVAAPSLPAQFREDGAATLLEGSATACAQALRSGAPVIVADTEAPGLPPLMGEMRRNYGLGAVWSYPIFSDDVALGTLALLPLQPGAPDAEDESLIGFALQLARLALVHERDAHALRESEQRFRDFADLAADWFWEQDAEFRFTRVINNAHHSADAPANISREVIGKQRWELGYLDVPEAYWEEHRRLIETGRTFTDLRFSRRMEDGSLHHVEISGRPVFDAQGRLCGYRGVGRDITARVENEAQIRELNASLEARVKARTEKLEAANRELDAFNYSVSHDLRAPLRSIDGFSRVLLEDYADRIDEEGRDYLSRVRAAALRMNGLIDAMYQLSKLSRAHMQMRVVDLSAMARGIVAELREHEPERAVEVAIADGLAAEGDAALLRIVLANLLGNAWKYTGRIAAARIEFGLRRDGGRPAFYVADNGAGFDMQFGDKLFRLFQRLHREEEFPGHGVGLATVQRILRRHGGRIWAEAEKGRGATFSFTLWEDPLLRSEAEEEA